MEDAPEVRGLPLGSLEDKDLTLAYQRGEDGAYQAIYDRYSHRVHSVCRRMLGNGQDAQDAAQESFLRVYQALGRFNGRYQLGAWITRITTNICLDHIRAKSRRPKDVVPLEIAELDAHEDIQLDGPDEVVIRRSESRRVRKVLESLPPMHRAAIVLRDFEGLSYQEVAIALEITECQVKALIHRARQGFKRSWTSLRLGALLPTGLFGRVRKVHPLKSNGNHSSVQHLAETVGASAAPAASSCSAAFSHCGQFVADKFAPALTAMALGAASLAIPGGRAPAAAEPEVQVIDESDFDSVASRSTSASNVDVRGVASEPETSVSKTETSDTHAPAEPGAAPAGSAPAASPAPVASPSPSSSPTPPPPAGGSGSAPPATSSDGGTNPSNPPAPRPAFTAAIGFDGAPSATTPTSHQFRLTCLTRYFEQTLSTNLSYGGITYDAKLMVNGTSSDARLHLTIVKDNREYRYLSWGARPTATWTVGDKSGELRMNGEYGPQYGDDPDAAGLPGPGTFQLKLTFDCNPSPTPVTESVIFTTH